MSDQHRTVIVPTGVAADLRELSRRLGKQALNGMFATRLSPSGNTPATHFISCGHLPPAYVNAITDPVRLFTVAKQAWEDDGDVFPYTQAQVTNRLQNVVIHDGYHPVTRMPESPQEILARLGLQIITD